MAPSSSSLPFSIERGSLSTNENKQKEKRKSPDNIICIDLTGSDDDEEKNDEQPQLQSVCKRLKTQQTPKVKSEPLAAAAASQPIELADSEDVKPSVASLRAAAVDDPDIEVVDQLPTFAPAAAAAAAAPTADGIELVGTKNRVELPHMRCHCTQYAYTASASLFQRQAVNEKTCDQCYCYACDVLVKDCKKWSVHCHATDKGPTATYWKNQRNLIKQQKRRGTSTTTATAPIFRTTGSVYGTGPFPPDEPGAANNNRLTKCRSCGWFNKFAHLNFRHERMGLPPGRTKPMWFLHSGRTDDIHPTGTLDWCHACGRVASVKDLGKVQSKPFVPGPYSTHLGTKEMTFSLHTHDPRQMNEYQQRWQEHEQAWMYDKQDMQVELFEHRLGERPSLDMIVQSLPITTPDKIPIDGDTTIGTEQAHPSETEAILFDKDNDRLILQKLFNCSAKFGMASSETMMAYLDGDLRASWNRASGTGKLTLRVYVTTENLPPPGVLDPTPRLLSPPKGLTDFLGAWFDLFPFKLQDLCGLLRADDATRDFDGYFYSYESKKDIPIPPFRMNQLELEELEDETADRKRELADAINTKVQEQKNSFLLEAGSGSQVLGGICTNERDFRGMLQRYYREILPDVVLHNGSSGFQLGMIEQQLGIVSSHRHMRRNGKMIVRHGSEAADDRHRSDPLFLSFDAFLSREDYTFLLTSMRKDAQAIRDGTETLNGLVDHLENLGHAQAPYVEGLAVELLPFQQQTVQWATEREQIEGGINSFLWTKLPSVQQPNRELYFNPILEELSKSKPPLARGGIIAAQMGLGKTVISLALILRNTAPPLPISGSNAGTIPATPNMTSGQAFWDPDLYKRTSGSNPKRGSIVSSGTLVVCPVSLVGQWISEAKSKLKNPGLVYSYHGGSRKRDPHILAQNSIVVTTYETLASDDTYHANKSGQGSDYCAPCEQVRWWRVICDESHSIRNKGNKANAMMKLSADNKWLVSGTPINTSLSDLDKQLEFLGVEKSSAILKKLKKSTYRHISDRDASTGYSSSSRRRHNYMPTPEMPALGDFTFMMRSIMMRNSQKQKYRGTTTTLMSLPPKTYRSIQIDFNQADKEEYTKLDTAARQEYLAMKDRHGHLNMSKHYLVLTSKLLPVRTACAGGPYVTEAADESEPAEGEDDEDEMEENHKKKGKKKQHFSKYVFTSKLDALVEELTRIRDEDPTSKSLVFSHFASTLKWLQQELPRHGFQFRTLSGDMSMKKRAKALADFQNDPPTTIFLLSMRAGAVGINLTQANRVFIMEPCFNPALEAQAIGRVHRLGQKRQVEIVRLVMKDSVETRIVKMLQKKYGAAEGTEATAQNDGDKESEAGDDGDKKPAAVDDGDKKPAAEPEVVQVMVGSIATDKAQVVAEEFDLLFGVDEGDTYQRGAEPVDAAEAAPAAAANPYTGHDPFGSDDDHDDDWL